MHPVGAQDAVAALGDACFLEGVCRVAVDELDRDREWDQPPGGKSLYSSKELVDTSPVILRVIVMFDEDREQTALCSLELSRHPHVLPGTIEGSILERALASTVSTVASWNRATPCHRRIRHRFR